jgi:hypothetical protein
MQLALFEPPTKPVDVWEQLRRNGIPSCEVCGDPAIGWHFDGSPDLCRRHFLPERTPIRQAAVQALLGPGARSAIAEVAA